MPENNRDNGGTSDNGPPDPTTDSSIVKNPQVFLLAAGAGGLIGGLVGALIGTAVG
jgi:hypothetical protein